MTEPHLVTHPDDLIEGRQYRVEYVDQHGNDCVVGGAFKHLATKRLTLFVVIGSSRVRWRSIGRIVEGEQE